MYCAGYEASAVGGHEVDAGEPLPLLVGRQQLGRLVSLDPAAPERRAQLDERQVADQASLRPPESLEADDADRPRPEPALPLEPAGDDVRGQELEALEVERPADPDQAGSPSGMQAFRPQSGGREPGQVCAGRRRVEAGGRGGRGADDPSLDRPGPPRLDQLPAKRAEQRMSDGSEPRWTQPGMEPDHVPEQRVVREPAQERRVVVVEREDESHVVDAVRVGGAQKNGAVGVLQCASEAAARKREREQRAAPPTRRIAPRREREGIRTARPDDRLRHRLTIRAPSAGQRRVDTVAPMAEAIDPGVEIGHVHLKVADIDRALDFYHGVLGFDVMIRLGDQAAFISAGGYHHHIGLNTWESKGGSPPPPGTTGLYHVAIRYPSRAALAKALRQVLDAGIPLTGASDHGVSEAIYLRDPDGNGIELYHDRPQQEWPKGPDGEFVMYTRPLDVEGVLASAEL